jgi:hypothetical protein
MRRGRHQYGFLDLDRRFNAGEWVGGEMDIQSDTGAYPFDQQGGSCPVLSNKADAAVAVSRPQELRFGVDLRLLVRRSDLQDGFGAVGTRGGRDEVELAFFERDARFNVPSIFQFGNNYREPL